MATVKGDVHDIGKNIVGVVLQCNNYEVIDLGVMVPAQKILDTAREIGADVIGLSGLITPSLDEMVNVAAEMQRQGFDIPLLIGGATTSRAHTAVKVDRQVRRPGGLGQGRLALGPGRSPRCSATTQRPQLLADVKADYDSLRDAARRQERPADAHAASRPRAATPSTGPTATGRTCCSSRTARSRPSRQPRRSSTSGFEDYDLAELRDYIDWQPFFNAWEMKGKFPDILNNPTTGEAARKLYDDAQAMLDQIIDEKWLTANGVVGFFPANAVGDDIEVYTDETRAEVAHHAAPAAPAGRAPRGRAQPVAGRLRRAQGDRAATTTSARSPSPPGSARQDRVDGVQGRPSTTTTRSCSSRWPTGSPRRSPSGCTSGSAREFWGYAPDERPRQRRPDRGEVRRHPAGAGLPRLPRAHREADPLGAARRRGQHRHRAHRVDGDVAGRVGLRLVLLPPAVAVLRGRPARPRPGRGLRRAQGLDPRRGRAVALAEPRLRPRGLSVSRPGLRRRRVLWDMDGTLVDTEPYWIAAEYALAEKYGGTWSRRARAQPGRQRPARVRPLHPRAHGDRPRARRDRRGAPRRGGRADRAGGAVAARCGRAARRPARGGRAVRAGDDVLPAVRRADPGRACRPRRSRPWSPATQVERGKPHPEPYLKAARLLGVDPGDCLAIEDSNTGAQSAEAAGCPVLVVVNHVPVLEGARRVFRDSLAGLTAADLAGLSAPSDD